MYSKRGKTLKKRILSAALSLALVVPMFSCVVSNDMTTVNAAKISNPRVAGGVTTWDTVYFGRYQQSDATGKKKDAIKWRVLQVNGNDAFLMADCNLDTQKFNKNFDQYEWSQSIIRSWLNGYGSTYNAYKQDYSYSSFISTAFTATEQEAIMTTDVTASANPDKPAKTTVATKDKVFLLSYQEVTDATYGFSSSDSANASRERINTAWVAKGGTTSSGHTNDAGKNGGWWLRTPGKFTNNALYVWESGNIPDHKGMEVQSGKLAVCPAIHLDISKSTVWSYAGTVDSSGKTTSGDNPPVVDATVDKVVTDPTEEAKGVTTKDDNGETVAVYSGEGVTEENVIIPETMGNASSEYKVTTIGGFKNNKNIKTVTIAANVKTIDKEAFSGCSNLQTVIFKGNNVNEIGAKAFYKCTKLKKIVIPASVNKIGKQAFYGCKNLKSITIKTTKLTNKKVGAKAFKGTNKKATFKVPKKKLSAYKKLLKSKGANKKAKFKK